MPQVRLPEDKGQVASAPPPAPSPVTSTMAPPTMPPLQYPTVSQMTQLQVQNYLQQLLLLQQQNTLLMNQSTNPVFQTSQTGFQGGQIGVQPLVLNPIYPFVAQAAPSEPVKPTAQDPLNLNSISSDSSGTVSTISESLPPSSKTPPITPPPSLTPRVGMASELVDNEPSSRGESRSRSTSVEPTSKMTSVEPRSRTTSEDFRSSRSDSCETEVVVNICEEVTEQLIKRYSTWCIHTSK